MKKLEKKNPEHWILLGKPKKKEMVGRGEHTLSKLLNSMNRKGKKGRTMRTPKTWNSKEGGGKGGGLINRKKI
jgi:hypothetical protein